MRLLPCLLALFSASPLAANPVTLGDLVIDTPHAYATPAMARTGAAYLTITNTGATDEWLLSVTGDLPRIEIHTVEMTDGMATMRRLDVGVAIPAGETVSLAPGGEHIMLMGLPAPLVAGETLDLGLVFDHAGELALSFDIIERPEGDAAHGH